MCENLYNEKNTNIKIHQLTSLVMRILSCKKQAKTDKNSYPFFFPSIVTRKTMVYKYSSSKSKKSYWGHWLCTYNNYKKGQWKLPLIHGWNLDSFALAASSSMPSLLVLLPQMIHQVFFSIFRSFLSNKTSFLKLQVKKL